MMEKRLIKKQQLRSIAIFLIFAFLISGCDVLNINLDIFTDNGSKAENNESDQDNILETIVPTVVPTSIPTMKDVISIWVQPIFDPDSDNPASQQFKNHLDGYSEKNPGVELEYRLKGTDGANSILHTLSITAEAAPEALPTVVLLTRQDMEKAAAMGLIRPIDFFADVDENNDWYPFAVKMGLYKNEIYGFPFAADVMVMATKNNFLNNNYASLASQPIQFGKIGFAAGNSKSLLPFLWYQSAGGKFLMESDRLMLDESALLALFNTVADNKRAGNFSASFSQYITQTELIEAYTAGDLDSVIIWSSKLRANLNESAMTFIPMIGNAPYTYADGWVWCLVQNATSDVDRNIDFLQYMVSAEFLQKWTVETDYLPVRPSTTDSLDGTQAIIDNLLLSADIIPSDDVRDRIGQILSEEMSQLLQGTISPEIATQTVISMLEKDEQSE